MKHALLAAALAAVTATARHHEDMHSWRSMGHLPGRDWQHVRGAGNSTFKQFIDHSNPELGTFEQFYYYDTTYWKGPGSPIVLFTPGEVNATGYTSYLSTNRTTGVIAERIGAATIVLEHRYWGTSTPFADLTTENLKHLTLENSIKDLTNFAKTVRLPFARHSHSNAADVPWVFSGGSYSGALAAWVEAVDPGTIWAYHSSSAPVQAVSDYWGYFLPVQQGMPKNCSTDVSLVIDHMDEVLTSGSDAEVLALKTKFGMQDVLHNDDLMAALENGPWLWQGNQFYRNTGFFDWCDYIENVHFSQTNSTSNLTTYKNTSTVPGPEGVGLAKALEGYAAWTKAEFLPGYCESFGYFSGELNTDCLDTYNASNPMFTDTSLSNTLDRQWVWMTCNEPFGYWQTGAPRDRPTIVSRLVTPEYWIRQCGLYFSPAADGTTYGLSSGRTEAGVNAYTQGWQNTNTSRLIYVNGDFDPWREASVSSDLRPEGPLASTKQVPVKIVPGGFHTSDLVTQNGAVNEEVKQVIDEVVEQIAAWVGEFPKRGYWRA